MPRLIIAASDITAGPKLFARFRGKTAKESYRFAKGLILTREFTGPTTYALATIPGEMSKGFFYSAVGSVGHGFLMYLSSLTFLGNAYKFVNISSVKNAFRIGYNVVALPVTFYFKGVGTACDILQISKLEEMWFGTPVYIFNDNRLWLEGNFTAQDILINLSSDD